MKTVDVRIALDSGHTETVRTTDAQGQQLALQLQRRLGGNTDYQMRFEFGGAPGESYLVLDCSRIVSVRVLPVPEA